MRPCGASCSRRRRCCSASLRLRGTINIKLRLGGLACSTHRWRSDDNFVPDHVDSHLKPHPICPFPFLTQLSLGHRSSCSSRNSLKDKREWGMGRRNKSQPASSGLEIAWRGDLPLRQMRSVIGLASWREDIADCKQNTSFSGCGAS